MRSVVMAAVVVGAGACAPGFDAIEADAEELAITFGSAADGFHATSAVALMLDLGSSLDGPFCSGVLLRPDLVLTAAHCVDGLDAADVVVFVGVEPTAVFGPRTYSVTSVDRHPAWRRGSLTDDLAALHLSRDVTQRVRYFPPVPASLAFSSPDLGTRMLAVGFGVTESTVGGTREQVGVPLVDLASLPGVMITDGSTASVCSGDSGGPLFTMRAGTPHIAGIHAFVGDEACSSFSGHTRLDQQEAFLSTL